MKKLMLTALLGLTLPAQAHNLTPGSPQDEPVLLQGGTLHTVTQGTLEETDILLVDGRIEAIGTDLDVPDQARVKDISGQQVYPGIIAMETSLGLVEMSQVRATVDTDEVGNITPEVRAHTAFNADSEIIPTVRYNGITHAQVVPQGNLIQGQSSLLHLDGWHWEDALVQADLGVHVNWPRAGLNTAWWEQRSPAEQRAAAREARAELKDVVETAKAYHEGREAGSQQQEDLRWEAMRGLFTGEKKLFVHADDRRQIEQVLEFNDTYGFDLVIMGGRDSWQVAEELAAAEVPVVFGAPYGLPARVDEAYDTAFRTPAKLAEAGVQFAIAYPGFWDVRNLAFGAGQAVTFGLDYDDAVAALTQNPADIMGVGDQLGSLEEGKQATLIVSEGDVLDHLGQRLSYMFIDGRQVDLSNRHRQLYEKYRERLQD